MWNHRQLKEVVSILMESKFYFRLTLRERYQIVKYLMANFR